MAWQDEKRQDVFDRIIVMKLPNRYNILIEKIFLAHYRDGLREVSFDREEFVNFAKKLRLKLPKNLGDIIYTYRYRSELPEAVRKTAPAGETWMIRSAGASKYRFTLSKQHVIGPNQALVEVKIPDATPGIIEMYALGDEQALLAKLRYNRLLDIFTGVTCYSLQSHLRMTVKELGQIETDELYVGVDRRGAHYILPVQAKGGKDRLSPIQIEQDIALCRAKFPELICRPVAAQFMADDLIALFELADVKGEIKVVNERHYRLVPADNVSPDDLRSYQSRPE